MPELQDRRGRRERPCASTIGARLDRSVSTTTACSSRSFSLASSAAANRASSAASCPRAADPAIADGLERAPLRSCESLRGGAQEGGSLPVEREGRALRCACEQGAEAPTRDRSRRVARYATRRDNTTLSSRPRPTAPANRPTIRSQAARSGELCALAAAAPMGPGETAPIATGGSWQRLTRSAQSRSSRSGSSPRDLPGPRSGRQERPRRVPRDRELRKDERCRAERTPGVTRRWPLAAEPEPTEQDRATPRRVGRRTAWADRAVENGTPRQRSRGEPLRALRLNRPGTPNAHDRPSSRRLKPEHRLQAECPGCGIQGDRIEFGHRARRPDEMSRVASNPYGFKMRPERRGRQSTGRLDPTPSGPAAHGVGDSHETARSVNEAIRASLTPTPRNNRARSVG